MVRVAVLVSGGGTNLQALLDAQKAGDIFSGSISLVVSSRPGVYALERAAQNNVPAETLARKKFAAQEEFDQALLKLLEQYRIDVVVLAGFLTILGPEVIQRYPNRILNIHPALIPSFCGKGFYGLKVHEAALARGVKVTGATAHLVNEEADGGPILLQKAVEVAPDDTAETLQRRVMEQAEWSLLPQAVELVCRKEGPLPRREEN